MDHSHWSQHEPMIGSRIAILRQSCLSALSVLTDHRKTFEKETHQEPITWLLNTLKELSHFKTMIVTQGERSELSTLKQILHFRN